MKRCIFGGAFDPVHLGHIQIVEYLIKLNFDEIIILPTYDSTYKKISANYEARIKMCELLVKDSRVKISKIEKKINSSFMIDVLNIVDDPNITLVIGSDQAKYFDQWKDYQNILEKCNVIVYNRLGTTFNNKFNFDVYNVPIKSISSTQIRKKLENKENISGLVDEKIEKYIREEKLYQENYE